MDSLHTAKIKSYLNEASQLKMCEKPFECSRNLINLYLYISFECEEFVKANEKFRLVVVNKCKNLIKEIESYKKLLPEELYQYTDWILNYTLEKYSY